MVTRAPSMVPAPRSRLDIVLSIGEPNYPGRDRAMGNDPLAVERNRVADWEVLRWTRGRSRLKHTKPRNNGQHGLFSPRYVHYLPAAPLKGVRRGRVEAARSTETSLTCHCLA